jgi:hypothetical protein
MCRFSKGLLGLFPPNGNYHLEGLFGLFGFVKPTGLFGLFGFVNPNGLFGLFGFVNPSGLFGLFGFANPAGLFGLFIFILANPDRCAAAVVSVAPSIRVAPRSVVARNRLVLTLFSYV